MRGRHHHPNSSRRKERFAAWLKDSFFLRFHMSVILGLAFVAGLAVTKLFLWAGNTNLALRYGVAVAVSYAAFMALFRLWLWYVAHADDDDDVNGLDVLDAVDGADFVGGTPRDLVAEAPPSGFASAGGSFGGGGASGSFGEAATDGAASLVGDDEGGAAVAVILAIAALVLAVLFAGLYLVYAAPTILAETAFQALLAPALIPAARRAEAEGWVPGAIRATMLPFACMLVAAVGFGWAADGLCPDARRMAEVIACARQ